MDGIVLEVIEAAIHQILFRRQVYPARIFAQCQKMGVPIMKSEHPWVNRFIQDQLRSLAQLSQDPDVLAHSLDCLITSGQSSSCVERFVFELDFPRWLEPAESPGVDGSGLQLLEAHFRALLLKLNSAILDLAPLASEDIGFSLEFRARGPRLAPRPQELNWCLQGEGQLSATAGERAKSIIPVYRFQEPHPFQVYILH